MEKAQPGLNCIPFGVPQSLLLGPLFFFFFFVISISDLPEAVMPGNTIALYADDCIQSENLAI